ncbi:hypothetical protein J1N35_015488 [Gossypium stocksii]|uniref:Reverse transcriptase n=1 Tax=Gossypium stocksii TaxID=47602 RepID=A0A9D3VWH3_9ROSI|nr:hypothetical protein J1N35_015488 [Gossypium stocksii]
MERIRYSCGYVNGIKVDSEGTRGGLCLAWKAEISVILHSYSKRHIDVVVDDDEIKGQWRFTSFYGSPYAHDRINTMRAGQGMKESIFIFEAWWTLEESFDEEKLDKLKQGLRQWVARVQSDRKKRKKVLINRLSDFLTAERDDYNLAELINTKIQLNLEIDKDERYWEQRTRINWLRNRDRNTAFFHSYAIQRRRRNRIHKIQDERMREAEALQDIEGIARAYL